MRLRLSLQLLREPELRGETLLLPLRLLARAAHCLIPRCPDLLQREQQPHTSTQCACTCSVGVYVHVGRHVHTASNLSIDLRVSIAHLERQQQPRGPRVLLHAASLEQRAALRAVKMHLPHELGERLVVREHLSPQVGRLA